MEGWQAVASLAVGVIGACVLSMTGHENVAIGIGVGITNGVFALLTQVKHRTQNGNGSDGK